MQGGPVPRIVRDYDAAYNMVKSFLDGSQEQWDCVHVDAFMRKWNDEIESLLKLIAPCTASEKMRGSIVEFVKELVARTLGSDKRTRTHKLLPFQRALLGRR